MKLALVIASALLPLLLSTHAHAQPRKCTAADGKVTYSDVACPGSTATERTVETRGNTLDGSGLREQVQKDKEAVAQKETQEQERATLAATQRQMAQTQAAETAKQDAMQAQRDQAASAACVRDVERHQVEETLKAELYAACRTAGASQRQTRVTDAALQECIRNVERTGAAPWDKARQTAVCHGADVKPEPAVVVLRPRVRTMGPPRITTCTGNQCSDEAGQRYFKQQGSALVREDGKACQLAPGNTVRCP